ncbi:MAG: MMPL family transporter [Planctomycetota bacterium]|nr:MMPL family transporter [Planctomycetota bacterium]
MLQRMYHRFGPLACILAVLSWPVLLYGAKGAFDSNTNNVLDWLPNSFDETTRLMWFVERFGSDEILVVSWPGCTLDDERLDRFAAALTKPVENDHGEPGPPLFRHVFTGRQTLAELQAPPLELSPRLARHRMRGWLLGPDGKTTCAVALVSTAGVYNRPAALQAVYRVASSCGLPREQLRIGGPTADSVAIDQASQQWMWELTLLAAFWGMLVAWACLRKPRLVAGVFFAASFAWSVSLAAVYFTGTNMDAVLLMMPGLVFVLGVSGAVHLTNYYRDGLRQHGPQQATAWAISRGWLPCTLACGTTSIGLGSLALSHIKPITKFGIFSALGVFVVMVTLLLLWPSVIQWWSSGDKASAHARSRRSTRPHTADTGWWHPAFVLATNGWPIVLFVTVLMLPVAGLGVWRLDSSTKLEDLLQEDSELIQSYTWLQDSIGPLVPVEVVLRFTPREAATSGDLVRRVQTVEQLRRRIDRLEHMGGTIAASTFVVPIPQGGGLRQVVQRTMIASQIKRDRDKLITLRYLYEESDAELWRISTRVQALAGVDYGQVLDRLHHEVDDFLDTQKQQQTVDVSAQISGAVPLIYMAQKQLLRDLVKSFLTAFALIALLMAAVLANPTGGLLSMIPNIFPAVVVFGAMGLAGTALDIGAMMTASAALGIAVDDTLHFLVWFRRGLRAKLTRREAIRYAYQHCASPMLQTTLICGLGLLVFALSPFTPIARFAWLMAFLLLLALVADLLLLPAILASPLGRFFVPAKAKREPVREASYAETT